MDALVKALGANPPGAQFDCIWPNCRARIAELRRGRIHVVSGPQCKLYAPRPVGPEEDCAAIMADGSDASPLLWRLTMVGKARRTASGWAWDIHRASLLAVPRVSH